MATKWLGSGGSNSNTGDSYVQRYLTLTYALTQVSQGDTINIVGSLDMEASAPVISGTTFRGTSYSDPALRIRGTDSLGSPALASIVSGDTTNLLFVTLNNMPDYMLFEGLDFDYSARVSTGTGIKAIAVSGTGRYPVKVMYSRIQGNTDFLAAQCTRLIYSNATLSGGEAVADPEIEVERCYLEHAYLESGNGFTIGADHCVFKYTGTAADVSGPNPFVSQLANVTRDVIGAKMTNCTIDITLGIAIPATGKCFHVFTDYIDDTTTDKERAVHSNLICIASPDSEPSTTQLFNTRGVIGNGQPNTAGVWAGDVGYNYFVFDTNVTTSFDASATADVYVEHYNPGQPAITDGKDLYDTDVLGSNKDISDYVQDAASAWNWDTLDLDGYSIPLPRNYTLIAESVAATAALDAGPVGAIDPGISEVDPVPIDDVLDTAPFFQPTLRVTSEFREKSIRNRQRHRDITNYTDEVAWNESTHRVINLPPSTTEHVTLGGVGTAAYFILETDSPISVSINDASRYWTVDKAVALAHTAVTTVYIKNESTTDTAQVILAVAE